MTKKQLVALMVCSLTSWTAANGFAPLLPVWASRLGANSSVIGYYLSFSFVSMTAGTLFAGWLSDKLQNRKNLLIASGVLILPVVWMMGDADSIWQLIRLTAVHFFLGGFSTTLIGILTGLFSGKDERGRIFGYLGMTNALGAVIGGVTCGAIADHWGYPTMFAVLAIFRGIIPLTATMLEDKVVIKEQSSNSPGFPKKQLLSGPLLILVFSNLMIAITFWVGHLGRSLSMMGLGFSSASISSTTAVAGAVTLPLLPLLGWLSDKAGRKRFMALCYLSGVLGLFLLTVADSLWHFWILIPLIYIANHIGSWGVGSALVTDLVPKEFLGRGMSLYRAATWSAAIIGAGVTGYAIDTFGMSATFLTAASLPVIAMILLIFIRQGKRDDELAE